MSTIAFVLAGLAMLAVQCHAVAVLGGPYSDDCPVVYPPNGGKCYKIFTFRPDNFKTRSAGQKFCAKDAGAKIADYEKGKLANIQDEAHFQKIINYMRYYDVEDSKRQDLTTSKVVPVLTGMTFEDDELRRCGNGGKVGAVQDQSVYGNFWESNYVGGPNVVIRVSKKSDDLCRMFNRGDSSARYRSILCEYETK